MINSKKIYIGIAGFGIAMLVAVGMEDNLFQQAAAGQNTFPQTQCEIEGGTYDHWDKIIFINNFGMRDSSNNLIKSGTVVEFKFPQNDPFVPVNTSTLVADHLNSPAIGWTNGAGNPLNPQHIFVLDVDYSAECIFPQP